MGAKQKTNPNKNKTDRFRKQKVSVDRSDTATLKRKKKERKTWKVWIPPSVPAPRPMRRVNKLTHTAKVVHDKRDLFVFVFLCSEAWRPLQRRVWGWGASDLAVTLLGFSRC